MTEIFLCQGIDDGCVVRAGVYDQHCVELLQVPARCM